MSKTKPDTAYDPQAGVAAFNRAGGVKNFYEASAEGTTAMQKFIDLRISLIKQETQELIDELLEYRNGHGDLVRLAKESADVKYVTYAVDDLFGIPGADVFNEVQRSNMTKVDETGHIQRDATGKILKGPNYEPPNLFPIVLGIPDPEVR